MTRRSQASIRTHGKGLRLQAGSLTQSHRIPEGCQASLQRFSQSFPLASKESPMEKVRWAALIRNCLKES